MMRPTRHLGVSYVPTGAGRHPFTPTSLISDADDETLDTPILQYTEITLLLKTLSALIVVLPAQHHLR